MIKLILRIVLKLIDKLVKDEAERMRLKSDVIRETARYHDHVLDSVRIRAEYDRLKAELKTRKP